MEMIEATIRLNAGELKKLMKQQQLDRHAAMVEKYGEACTKTTAAKLISCSTQTIGAMLKDGRIQAACGGKPGGCAFLGRLYRKQRRKEPGGKADQKRASKVCLRVLATYWQLLFLHFLST